MRTPAQLLEYARGLEERSPLEDELCRALEALLAGKAWSNQPVVIEDTYDG